MATLLICSNFRLLSKHLLRKSYVCASFSTGKTTSKINFNVGTIGHIDHGKTTLTSAITKVLSKKGGAKYIKFDEIDKGKEEMERGITINIAHIGYESKNRRYAHTDCPGHSDFIKNMICGTSQMDAAILVIAATDGVMAQTKEHLLLAKQIGLKNIVVFINKADVVQKDDLELVELEARELLSENGFNGDETPVVVGSALQALEDNNIECIEKLVEVLDGLPAPQRKEDAPFLMPIASRVVITGRGTVVVGTVAQGTLKKGEQVQIAGFGSDIKTVATDIQIFRKSVKEVVAGEHCGILCRNLKSTGVERGMWLGAPGSIITSNFLRAELYLLSEEESGKKTGIRSGFTDRIFCSTWDEPGRLLFKEELLMPGEHVSTHLLFINNVPIMKNMPFTLRQGASQKTIGRGIVTDILKPIELQSFAKLKPEELVEKAEVMNV
uniref:Tr-type G domain-containing protein n=1 Tax=Panagrolaimus sp. JU765 TaxID=591449 RepID=A0AC34PWG3_9BILA